VSLLAQALALGARPRLRITLRETEDPEADLARARPLFQMLASAPGCEAVVVTIVRQDGGKDTVLFRCSLPPSLLRELSKAIRQATATASHRR
jgi:hypothetical protein